jgi:diaminohydroxyphosphoribosylaminopyrimidine deaminase/5-amino-6-(5-phosphoribosylamino)uracil reductase
MTQTDAHYMSRALQLARLGRYTTRPNPNVGCVIVKHGQIIGEGYHRKAGEPHAEINALLQAGDSAKDATVYVTLEPCSHTGRTPPCANALIEASVKRVVIAMTDPNPEVSGSGIARLRDAGIEVTENILGAPARQLNRGFIKRMQSGLPYVRLKLAASLDGRTAMANGESKWITGVHARADVHRMRASAGAIITGSGTVVADDPELDFRVGEFSQLSHEIPQDTEQPLKIIVDSALTIPVSSRILRRPDHVMIATIAGNANRDRFVKAGLSVDEYEPDKGKVPLENLLQDLAARNINDVMIEAGPGLAGAFLGQQLVDEIVIYMAPHIMGDAARGMFGLPGLEHMQNRISVNIDDIRAVGEDWRIIVTPRYT